MMAHKLPVNALEEGVLLNLLCPQFCPKSFRLVLYKELRDDVLAVGCHYRLLREHYWILQKHTTMKSSGKDQIMRY